MAKKFVRSPVLREFDRSPSQVPMVLLQLRLEAAEKRERVGGRSRKSGQDLILIKPSDFARRVLNNPFAQSYLPVPGHYHISVAANAQHCCRANQALFRHECQTPIIAALARRLSVLSGGTKRCKTKLRSCVLMLPFIFLKLDDRWLPKSVICLRDYDLNKFAHDVLAGITVGLVALPLAMAFAIASGLTPQAGIYCAIVTGFLISALGGSKTQIGGPTGAFVVVVAAILAAHGVDGLFLCTVMAGVLLVIMGVTGLGSSVKFIPRPIVIGFTNGIAVLIASTQIKDFFGLKIDKVPGVFSLRIEALAKNFHTLSFEATALAVFTLLTLIICRSVSARIPGPIVALLLATSAVYFFKLPVETIGTKFGGIPGGLPHLEIPKLRADLIHGLLGPALTVAMLGAIESLMSAVVSDRMSNDRHNPNV